jgi:hypothetical protein
LDDVGNSFPIALPGLVVVVIALVFDAVVDLVFDAVVDSVPLLPLVLGFSILELLLALVSSLTPSGESEKALLVLVMA